MLRDETGFCIDPDEAAQTYAYNADGTIHTITAVANGRTWVKTFTYSSGLVSTISPWVKS